MRDVMRIYLRGRWGALHVVTAASHETCNKATTNVSRLSQQHSSNPFDALTTGNAQAVGTSLDVPLYGVRRMECRRQR